jgi:hypothetical protein
MVLMLLSFIYAVKVQKIDYRINPSCSLPLQKQEN